MHVVDYVTHYVYEHMTSVLSIISSAVWIDLNWREVILNLDYPEFNLDSPKGLALIITGFKSVSRDPFPLETIYLGWSSTSSQLSLLKQAIKGSPEFSIAQFPLCSMQLSDELKANLNSEDARTWYVPIMLLASYAVFVWFQMGRRNRDTFEKGIML